MFERFRPLKCREVRQVLERHFDFVCTGQKGSHEQYEKIVDGRKYKVTVDCHGGEVKAMDVRPIISQAGLTKSEFYAAFKK